MESEIIRTSSEDTSHNQHGYVTLPYNENQFKEFITSLLGQPQTIESTIKGAFELSVDDINSILSAIEQRIAQQNNGKLVAFSSRIIFSDNTSIILNSPVELLSYNQIKPVVCDSLHLTLVYLIKFASKETYEKQEINISFLSNLQLDKKDNTVERRIDKSESLLLPLILDLTPEGLIQCTIKHTDRTWGADIEALISNLIANIAIHENPNLKFIRNNYRKIMLLSFVSTCLCGFYLGFKIEKALKIKYLAEITKIYQETSKSLVDIDNKIKYLTTHISDVHTNEAVGVVTTFVFFIFSIMMFIILSSTLNSNKKWSYILLSKETSKYKLEAEKKYSRGWIITIISLIINILINISSSFIYDYFCK